MWGVTESFNKPRSPNRTWQREEVSDMASLPPIPDFLTERVDKAESRSKKAKKEEEERKVS